VTTPAAPPATPPATPPAPTAEAAIRTVLDRYRLGYDERDADAVGVAWPMANTKALAKAFAQLDQQKLQFDQCSIKPAGVLAQAICSGKAMYVPKVGNKTEHVDARQWTFELRLYNGVWVITSVQSK
jgi:hypothetical protein